MARHFDVRFLWFPKERTTLGSESIENGLEAQ